MSALDWGDEMEEKVRRLEAEVERMRDLDARVRKILRADCTRTTDDDAAHVMEMLTDSRAEVERLRGALLLYGEHPHDCARNVYGARCTCGLNAALEAKP